MMLSKAKLGGLLFVVGAFAVGTWLSGPYRPSIVDRVKHKLLGRKSFEQRMTQLKPGVEARLKPSLEAAGLAYPPERLRVIAFKEERQLELYGQEKPGEPWRYIKRYPLLGKSGVLGPKLLRGDEQIPEGFYRITHHNPNSGYHVSMKLDYPNEEDRAQGYRDKREKLGGDIFIHGGGLSVGCLAIGDEGAEELFVLTGLMDLKGVEVWISPIDFRQQRLPAELAAQPEWVHRRYDRLAMRLAEHDPR